MSAAITSILVLVVCVFLWVTEIIPLVTTAMIGVVAMVALKACSFTDAFSGFGSSTVMLVIGMVTLGNAMFETGAAQLLGRKVLSVASDNERLLLGISAVLACIISAFLSNTATVAMFMAIFGGLAAVNPKIKPKNLIMPVGMASVAGGVCTLVGSTPQVVAQGILIDNLGKGFEFFDFALIGAPICICMVIYFITIGYPMGKRVWGSREEEESGVVEAAAASTITPEDSEPEINMSKVYMALIIFALTVVAFVTKAFNIGITCMISGLLCILTGCISQKKAIEKMDWNALGILAGSLGIAKALQVSGGGEMIANGFVGLFGADITPFILYAVIIFIAMAMSQFMSNTGTTAILVPIVLFICKDMGLNPYAFAMGIVIAANMSFSTPVATTPITLTLTAGYRFTDYVKVGGPFNIIAYFLILIVTPIVYSLRL